MTGIVAQLIALSAYGNNYLKKASLPSEFYRTNSSFQYCNRVDFRKITKAFFFAKAKEVVIADSPALWFSFLKQEGCQSLRLYFKPSADQSFAKDHKLAGLVGGGGTWLIEAVYSDYSNYWTHTWEVTNQHAADHKIWTVNYLEASKNQPTNNIQIETASVKENLAKILDALSDFSFKHNLQFWAKQFEEARLILDSDTPMNNRYHSDLIPLENYSLTTRQVLFAATTAWAFGGMGSWNDLSFESKEENELYEQLSEQLYDNVNKSFISVVNSF